MRVPIYEHSQALEITSSNVVVNWGGEIFALPANSVILALGTQSNNKLAQELKELVPEMYEIGGCVKPADASTAVCHAAMVAGITGIIG